MRLRYILSGAAANLYGQAVTIGTQLLSVPILIGIWGLHDFGLWTMLITIPALLLAMDFGYSAAAAGMMSKAIALGDEADAQRSLHTAFAVISAMALVLIAVAGGLGLFAGAHRFAAHAGMGAEDIQRVAAVAPWMIVYVALTLPAGLINAVYRVNDRYPLGVLVYETARLVEQILVLGVVLLRGGLVDAAIALVCARIVFTILSTILMLRVTPWVRLSYDSFCRKRLAEMFRPAMGAMFIPLCIIAGVQGVTLAVGVLLSPSAAGGFATVRVLFRLVVQVVGTLSRASVPEFALVFARNDRAAQVRMARLTMGILAGCAAAGSVALLIAGPTMVAIWTHGKVAMPYSIYVIMVTHSFFGCIWNGLSNLITGLNRHSRYVPQLIAWNVLGVTLLFVTIPRFGLEGAACGVALIDILSFISVYRVWLLIVPSRSIRPADAAHTVLAVGGADQCMAKETVSE
jgi:O-antigen/teichoic acid export membrane protein